MSSSLAIFRITPLNSLIYLSLFLSPTLSALDYSFDRIGFLPGEENTSSMISHLSRDGSTVIGAAVNGGFVWSTGNSMIDVPGSVFTNVYLSGVSANGAVVVGSGSHNASYEAFRWTAEKGAQSLGFLTPVGDNNYSGAAAVSQDGQVVVGSSRNVSNEMEAFRWTEDGGMQGLGFLGANHSGSRLSAGLVTNYSGNTVAGHSTNATRPNIFREAFIWTESEGMQGLGFIGDGGTAPQSAARYLSDDGLVVAGESSNANDHTEAFRWTKEHGMQGLGFIGNGGTTPGSSVAGMSSDGSVIVGASTTPIISTDGIYYQQAFRWTEETGMVGLGYLGIGNIGPISMARGISADGSTIIGASTTAQDKIDLFVWRSDTGMFSLVDFMFAQGIDLRDWVMADASGVSGNGEIISGAGYNPDMAIEGWLIRLPKPSVTPDPPTDPEKTDPEDKPKPPVTPPVGFISVSELNRSMSDMAYVPMSGLSVAQGALQDQRFISTEQCASEGVSDKRYCTFITGAGEFWRGDGTQGRGSVGVAVALSPSLSLGVSAYLGNQHYDLRLDGKNKMDSYGGALFLNYSEGKQGLRAFGAVTASHLDYDLRRHYRNGSYNISRSSGESSGHAVGGMVRLGWAFNPQESVSAIPFAELSWAKATMKGYREQGGTFPIDFDGRKANETDMRLGSELRYNLTDAVNVNGGVAWVHRLSGELDRVSGTVVGWSETSVSAAKLPTDWSEVSLGASYKLTPDMNVSASTTSTIGRSYQPDTSVRAGLSVSF
ncbi:Autotransporter protein or domain, integral membrane beta-barrel involved in protein secretion [Pragia fontium]|uniref:autotransporter domain-containing protein n=1 Tax=Pragia fontium TaxID=82985 RepID=UPI000E0534E4|nr:autotransporter domain-containing protein [Pragia fontium]SUB81454.1 Autotransporter protein or domain, integral membrane beta-barrel involved in protein secretion [Pragia fontium]